MFTSIRCLIVIGLIFYFSPARKTGVPEGHTPAKDPTSATLHAPHGPETGSTWKELWDRMVGGIAQEAARTATTGTLQSAGLRLKDEGPWSMAEPAAKPAPAETVRPSARLQARRDPLDQSARCIYRCEGAE